MVSSMTVELPTVLVESGLPPEPMERYRGTVRETTTALGIGDVR